MKHRLFIAAVVFSALVLGGCDNGQTALPTTPIPPEVPVTPLTVTPVPVTPVSGAPVSSEPILLEVVGHYNIVQFKGDFFAIPHGVGVNWEKDKVASLPGVLVASSQAGVVALLPKTP